MDSAASPPAKRTAPGVVAKAKRLILPPETDELAADAAPADPASRAKRAPRQPRLRKPAMDPGFLPPPPPEPPPPPDGDPAQEVVDAPPVESERSATAPTLDLEPAETVTDDLDPDARPAFSDDGGVSDSAVGAPRLRVAPPPAGPPIEEAPPEVAEEPVQPALFDAEAFGPERPMRPMRPPMTLTRRRRPRVRRVTRVVRHVDSWSVFKIALLFNLFFYVVCVTASVLLWQVAQSTGTVDNIERFFEGFGWQTFKLKGGELYHNLWVVGLFLVVLFTGLAVLMATMFNLITDLVGGVRVTVLEEEVVSRVKLTTLTPAPAEPAEKAAESAEPG